MLEKISWSINQVHKNYKNSIGLPKLNLNIINKVLSQNWQVLARFWIGINLGNKLEIESKTQFIAHFFTTQINSSEFD